MARLGENQIGDRNRPDDLRVKARAWSARRDEQLPAPESVDVRVVDELLAPGREGQ
jgi:hypothetical protein